MPLDYLINKGDLDGMHEETAKLITEWLTLVKEKGHNKESGLFQYGKGI